MIYLEVGMKGGGNGADVLRLGEVGNQANECIYLVNGVKKKKKNSQHIKMVD